MAENYSSGKIILSVYSLKEMKNSFLDSISFVKTGEILPEL